MSEDKITITRPLLVTLRDELIAGGDDPYGLAIVQMALSFGDALYDVGEGEVSQPQAFALAVLRKHEWAGA